MGNAARTLGGRSEAENIATMKVCVVSVVLACAVPFCSYSCENSALPPGCLCCCTVVLLWS